MDWPPLAMQWDPLAGIVVKLVRASQHIEELDKQVTRHLNTRPYRVASERQKDGWFVGSFQVGYAPLIMPSVVFGEIIGQFRSSLDHLMVAMIRLHDPNGKSEHFPICVTSPQFYDARGKRTPSWDATLRPKLRPEHFAFVLENQPFKSDSPTLATVGRLNNLDKHELIHAFYAGPQTIAIQRDPNVAEFEWLVDPTQRLYHGTQLYRVRYVNSTRVKVPMSVGIDVVIGPEDTYITVATLDLWLEEFKALIERVRGITPEFRGEW